MNTVRYPFSILPGTAVVALLFLSAGCEEDGGAATVKFDSIEVTFSENDVLSGTNTTAQAIGTTKGGDELDITDEVEWSTNPDEWATVVDNGEVRTHFPGEVEITASLGDASGTGTLSVRPALFTTGQNAGFVLGKPDFTTGSGGGVTATNYSNNVQGNSVAYHGRLYVPDKNNDRILGYNFIPTATGVAADFVIGQPTLTSSGSATTATRLYGPEALLIANGKFFVVDSSNHRVLIWNTPPTDSSTPADVVVGQPNFTTGTTGGTQLKMYYPTGVAVAGNKLLVSDINNNRVLIWNPIPTTNGDLADVVIGQTNFTNVSVNAGGSTSASSLSAPAGLWTDGTRLIVVDYGNNRLVGWDTIPTSNFEAADFVVGQSNFTTGTFSSASASRFRNPYAAATDGVQFALADATYHRVLIWNEIPTGDVPADVVLGQTNFTNNTAGLSQSRVDLPRGLYFYGRSLYVADTNNGRVMVFHGD